MPQQLQGRRTLPLQWASPEGTLTWGDILPGAAALTYLWLRDAETHAQPRSTHLLLTLEGDAAIETVNTTEGADHVTANTDTAVWLHPQEHTTSPTMVPGSHPWHLMIVHLPTWTDTGDAQQGWADWCAHVFTTLDDGLHKLSVTSHISPASSHHGRVAHRSSPPPAGIWAYTRNLHRGSPQDHHFQTPKPRTPLP